MCDMAEPDFGFTCGEFSVVLSGNDVILPGSKNAPLKKSLLPLVDMNDAAGAYDLEARSEGEIICNIPVQVVWVGHESQPEPFIGFRVDNSRDVMETLKLYRGRRVDLVFTRRTH
jgi:hypothetical protein